MPMLAPVSDRMSAGFAINCDQFMLTPDSGAEELEVGKSAKMPCGLACGGGARGSQGPAT